MLPDWIHHQDIQLEELEIIYPHIVQWPFPPRLWLQELQNMYP